LLDVASTKIQQSDVHIDLHLLGDGTHPARSAEITIMYGGMQGVSEWNTRKKEIGQERVPRERERERK
jgi:hypothetical protein